MKKYILACFLVLNFSIYGLTHSRKHTGSIVYVETQLNSNLGIQKNVRSRLGNQVIAYMKGKWLANQLGIACFFQPFDFDNLVNVNQKYAVYNFDRLKGRRQVVHLLKLDHGVIKKIKALKKRRLIYKVSFETLFDNKDIQDYNPWFVNLKHLQKRLPFKLKENIKLISQPRQDYVNIAIHIRRPGNFDLPQYSKQIFSPDEHDCSLEEELPFSVINSHLDTLKPLKVPPLQYYIDELNLLAQKLSNKKLYVFLFTDDINPKKLLNEFKSHIHHQNCKIETSETFRGGDAYALRDLVAMSKFDILIRPGSSCFSILAEILGNFKGVVYPSSYEWKHDYLIMKDIKRTGEAA